MTEFEEFFSDNPTIFNSGISEWNIVRDFTPTDNSTECGTGTDKVLLCNNNIYLFLALINNL